MLIREHYENREEWLEHRKRIGGSEIAAVIGQSPFMSNVELWELKTGKRKPKDLSGNENVKYGVRLESALRGLFQAEHPEMQVEYYPYDILYQDDIPYIACTLDGELTETQTGKKGILEIKTAQMSSKVARLKWDGKVPMNYYCQCLAQLIATGWDFVCLYAQLKRMDGDSEIRLYRFDREDCLPDMDWINGEAKKFWYGNIMGGNKPATILPGL